MKTKTITMFETASFHIVKPCNMKCKFCYETFNDMKVIAQLPKEEAYVILDKLKESGLQKITFAGGEPLLYKWLYEVIVYAKQIGLTTSIITNGSLLTNESLDKYIGVLDWIGVSVDSIDPETNYLAGRVTIGSIINYYDICRRINERGFKLKINTVVHRFNQDENLQGFIEIVKPARWKIFDTLLVQGQNNSTFEAIKPGIGKFNSFVERHNYPTMVVEDNAHMTGSYLLIDPKGRLFEDSKGIHTYSDPLQHHTVEHCLSQIELDREMFIERGGIYNW